MILAFDCAFETTSVAVVDKDGLVLSFKSNTQEFSQTEVLMPLIKEAMMESGVSFKTLTKIAVTKGPGSFTGIRIALASAQGLSFASNIPLVGVSTLEAVAFKANQTNLCVVLETKRDDFYAQTFNGLIPTSSPFIAEAEKFKEMNLLTFTGNGVERLCDEAKTPFHTYPLEMPDARTIAQIALTKEPSFDPIPPLYLRAAETSTAGAKRPLNTENNHLCQKDSF